MMGRRTLLTMGTFEIAHSGHAAFLRKCESFADEVIVGVNTDDFVKAYKGINPVLPLEKRIRNIQVLNPEYQVIPNPSAGRDLIHKVNPDVVAIGTDWLRKDYLGQVDMTADLFEEFNCSLLYLPYTLGISSSELKATLLGTS